MSSFVNTQQKFRRVYHDLINGYSTTECEGKTAFLKHVSEHDIGALDLYAQKHYEDAKNKGLPNEEEKLKILIDNGTWSKEYESKIKTLKSKVSELNETHKNLFLKRQIKESQKNIDKVSGELSSLISEKLELLGLTCEKYSERKSNEEIIYHCFRKDHTLKEKFFTRREFEEIHHSKLYSYINEYNKMAARFSYSEMKRLAAMPFFSNLYFMVDDDATKFYGKSIWELSVCQLEVFNISKVYKAVLSQGNSPSEDMYEDIDSVVSFFDSYSSSGSKSLKEAGNKDSQSIVGASIEEMRTMTSGKEGGENVVTLSKALEKATEGGKEASSLTMEEIVKMHGY